MRTALLGLAIGLALADSSIVTLALPEILGRFDVGVTTVAWVLTSFNLLLAVSALPAAFLARRRPRRVFVVGTAVFAASSLACGLATSFELLVAARCIQAVGAALVVTAALALLSGVTQSDTQAVRIWVAAGVLGAALGPAAGGILTEALGWESIFLVQVPLVLVSLVAAPRGDRATAGRAGRAASHHRQRSPVAALRRARGGALPARTPSRHRMGHVPGRGRARRDRPPARGDRGRTARAALDRNRRPDGQRGDPRSRRSRRARIPAACGLGVDDRTAGPRWRGDRPRTRGAHRASSGGACAARRARRLDAGSAARRSRARAPPARAGADLGARAEPRRSGAGRRRPRCSTVVSLRSTSSASHRTCSTRWKRPRTGESSLTWRWCSRTGRTTTTTATCCRPSRISSIAPSRMRSRPRSCSQRRLRSLRSSPLRSRAERRCEASGPAFRRGRGRRGSRRPVPRSRRRRRSSRRRSPIRA